MEKLFIVRHGSYYPNGGCLTSSGQEDIQLLSKKIGRMCKGLKVRILTSPAPRGLESAKIIAKQLHIKVEPHEVLWSEPGSGHDCDIEETLKLIQKVSATDVVILVTHLEYTDDLPHNFGHQVLGVTNFPFFQEINKGCAWFIDCVKKTCELVEPYSN